MKKYILTLAMMSCLLLNACESESVLDDGCQIGVYTCVNNISYICKDVGDGKTQTTQVETCINGCKDDGTCIKIDCEIGKYKCENNTSYICEQANDSSPRWSEIANCKNGCTADGQCIKDDDKCVVGNFQCKNTISFECRQMDDNTTRWLEKATCETGCGPDGKCLAGGDDCTENDTKCTNNEVQICKWKNPDDTQNSKVMKWESLTQCGEEGCASDGKKCAALYSTDTSKLTLEFESENTVTIKYLEHNGESVNPPSDIKLVEYDCSVLNETCNYKTGEIIRDPDELCTEGVKFNKDTDYKNGIITLSIETTDLQSCIEASSGFDDEHHIALVIINDDGTELVIPVTISNIVLDNNNNNKLDKFDIVKDEPWDADISCRTDADCQTLVGGDIILPDGFTKENVFCNSTLNYACDTKCLNNSQCLDGYICRNDGRCVIDEFIVVISVNAQEKITLNLSCYDKSKGAMTVTFGDGTDTERIVCPNDGSSITVEHIYNKSADYPVSITNLDTFNPNCTTSPVSTQKIYRITQFGNTIPGSFKNCQKIYIEQNDIPDASRLTNLDSMFENTLFSDLISNWDVSNVTSMKAMFKNNQIYAQTLAKWNVSNVTDMSEMFSDASLFNRNDLDKWDVSHVTNFTNMFKGSAISKDAFCKIMTEWNKIIPDSILKNFGLSYSCDE